TPHARKAVSLQLYEDGERIAPRFGRAAALLEHLAHDAELVLHVMAHLARDDVGAGALTRRPEPLRQPHPERADEIDTAVGRAIEGPHGGAGERAGGVDRAPEEHELRGAILASHLPEDGAPRVLRVAQDPRDEFLRLVSRPRR